VRIETGSAGPWGSRSWKPQPSGQVAEAGIRN
jgi:hypothetical protein